MELQTLPEKPEQKQTEVGSYFVANYPPFSVWSPGHKPEILGALDRPAEPETITPIGVTRLSLGVEHFDHEVLTVGGRAHKSPEIGRAYRWAREVGLPQINIDLIAGMLGETEDKWKYAVEEALELDPDSVTIYQMEVPFNTGIAKEAREHGGVSPVASWAQKRAWVDYAFKQFEAAGYVVSSAYTLVKPETHAGFVYRDSLWHGADLIGTGVAS